MKGPPKNIKTTVNPIKTLTPRFIVRAVEKMKKKKKRKLNNFYNYMLFFSMRNFHISSFDQNHSLILFYASSV